MINGKTANGSIINGQIQYETDGWRPLKLPSGITGQVFFKDNGNGTASLAGTIRAMLPENPSGGLGSQVLVLTPPAGYSFTGVDWNQGVATGNAKEMMAVAGLGDHSSGFSIDVAFKAVNGNFYAQNDGHYGEDVTMNFTESRTVVTSKSAGPAIVSISHV